MMHKTKLPTVLLALFLAISLSACLDEIEDGGSDGDNNSALAPDDNNGNTGNNSAGNNGNTGNNADTGNNSGANNADTGNNSGANNGDTGGNNSGANNADTGSNNSGANNGDTGSNNSGANNGGTGNNEANPGDQLDGMDPDALKSCSEGGETWEEADEICGTPVESAQFRLLNEDRVANGLQPLKCQSGLLLTARLHSQDMADRDYFDHVSPEGLQPWDRMEVNGVCGWRASGENIAAGQRTPAEVQEAWMNSPGHRANILTEDFTHVGVGVYNHNGQIFWTQLFATF